VQGSPQFPLQRALSPTHFDRWTEVLFSRDGGLIARILEEQLAFHAHELASTSQPRGLLD
jgi:hypothetical protein